jgi:hypothetical protein
LCRQLDDASSHDYVIPCSKGVGENIRQPGGAWMSAAFDGGVGDVVGQLSGDRAGLDDGHAYVGLQLDAQGL